MKTTFITDINNSYITKIIGADTGLPLFHTDAVYLLTYSKIVI